MPRAIAAKAGRKSSLGVSPSDQDPGAAVGAPADEVAHLRKMGRLKLHTAHVFLSNPSSCWKTRLWVSLCDPLMTMHYKLFKYGTWYGHRVSDRVSVFEFCSDATRNVVVQALDSLARTLFEPEQQASLTGLFGLLGGDMGGWPAAAKQALHVSALLAFSRLWRKLYRFFQCYPWKLAPGFDVRRDEAERRETVEQFLRASPCCLDEGFRRCCENMWWMADV